MATIKTIKPDGTGDYNASSDGTATSIVGGSNNLDNLDVTDQFTNETSDWSLLSTSDLKSAGTDVGIVYDSVGNEYSIPPSIGALEYIQLSEQKEVQITSSIGPQHNINYEINFPGYVLRNILVGDDLNNRTLFFNFPRDIGNSFSESSNTFVLGYRNIRTFNSATTNVRVVYVNNTTVYRYLPDTDTVTTNYANRTIPESEYWMDVSHIDTSNPAYPYVKILVPLEVKEGQITNSIGTQENLIVEKEILKELSSTIGTQHNINYEIEFPGYAFRNIIVGDDLTNEMLYLSVPDNYYETAQAGSRTIISGIYNAEETGIYELDDTIFTVLYVMRSGAEDGSAFYLYSKSSQELGRNDKTFQMNIDGYFGVVFSIDTEHPAYQYIKILAPLESKEVQINNSIGVQNNTVIQKGISKELISTIGIQKTIIYNISYNITVVINNVIGTQEIVVGKMGGLSPPIIETLGFNETINTIKTLEKDLLSSIGIQHNITYSLAQVIGTQISDSIGINESVFINTQRSVLINNSIGTQESIEKRVLKIVLLNNSIGFQVVVENATSRDNKIAFSLGFNTSINTVANRTISIESSLGTNTTIVSFEGVLYYVKQKMSITGEKDNTVQLSGKKDNKLEETEELYNILKITGEKDNKMKVVGKKGGL